MNTTSGLTAGEKVCVLGVVAVYAIVVMSCGGGATTAVPQPPPPPPRPPAAVTISVSPASSALPYSGWQPFSATVKNSTNTAVNWSIDEGPVAGTITSDGLFTASRNPGTYHVTATSVADSSKSATVLVSVAGTSVDELISSCPTAAEINDVNSQVSIVIDDDPTAPALVCTAADGSADLTFLQERTYQALRVMKNLPIADPLPWTYGLLSQNTRSLYAWFGDRVVGIRYRSDIQGTFCCDPGGVINVGVNNLAALNTTRWVDPATGSGLDTLLTVLVHEARHIDTGAHTCGANDQTLAELGAWGVMYYTEEWLAFHTDTFLMPTLSAPSNTYYQTTEWNNAQQIRNTRFCTNPPILAARNGYFPFQGSYDFAGVMLGQSVSNEFFITGGTPTTVSVSSANMTGDPDFRVSATTCTRTTIPPSCTATVKFMPTSTGTKSAELSVMSGDSVLQTVPITGTGGTYVSTYPASMTMYASSQWYFQAAVSGSSSNFVSWSISESSSGGSISSQGMYNDFAVYTAPPTPGTYHLVATSVADPSQSAVITVTVQ